MFVIRLAADTIRTFTRHGGTFLAGACAFFALLSAAPLFFIAVSLAGAVAGTGEARAELLRGLATWLGADGATTVGRLLGDLDVRPTGAGLVSVVVLVYGSTRLFTHLSRALDALWDVQPPRGRGALKKIERQIVRRAF